MATLGLRDVHVAKLESDDESGVSYETPERIRGGITATITPTINTTTLYADDGPSETASSMGEITVALNTKDLPKSIQALMLGHKVNEDGVLVKSADDYAPYVALGFRAEKSDGTYRYVWLYKGRFQPQEQNYQTKGDTPEFQTPTINAVFLKRDFDEAWQVSADQRDEEVAAGVIDNWFNEVYEEGGATA